METIAVVLLNLVLLLSSAGVAALLGVMLVDWRLESTPQAAAIRRGSAAPALARRHAATAANVVPA